MRTLWQRRQILLTGAAGLLGTAVKPQLVRAQGTSGRGFVILSGLPPEMPEAVLRRFLAAFAREGIPFTLSLDAAIWGSVSSTQVLPLQIFLSKLARTYPGLTEISLHVQNVNAVRPYFQARLIHDAFGRLHGKLPSHEPDDALLDQFVTVTGYSAGAFERPRGCRAAGIRNLVVLPREETTPRIDSPDREILRLSGGMAWDISEPMDKLRQGSVFLANSSAPGILNISLEGMDKLAETEAIVLGNAVVDVLSEMIDSGRLSFETPADFHLHSNLSYLRRVALAITEIRDASPDLLAWMARFQDSFVAVEPLEAFGQRPLVDASDCAVLKSFKRELVSQAGQTGESAARDNCSPDAREQLARRVIEWPDLTLAAASQALGLDDDAGFHPGRVSHINTAAELDGLNRTLSPYSDTIIALRAELLEDQGSRRKLTAAVRNLGRGQGNMLVDGQAYIETLTPQDAVLTKFRRERNLRQEMAPQVESPGRGDERGLLMRDAETAWAYLAKNFQKQTGLVPVTVFDREGRDFVYRRATMWDIGSQLLGMHAARRMGFIGEDAYVQHVVQVVRNLPETRIAGLSLPCSVVSTRTGKPLVDDFNACDVGRLLSALDIIGDVPEIGREVELKIQSWDLDKTIVDGVFHNISNGRFYPFYISHCAHYVSRVLRNFGYEIRSPYDVPGTDLSEADRQMHLLYAADDIGLLGAEPLLFESIELGWSEQSRYLTDILLTEQAYSYYMTGDLVCVSEVPINQAPWFTYQGLDLGSETNRWGIEAVSNDPKYSTETFKRKISLISTKGAYLWDSVHPHPYSTLLVDHVRERARIEGFGFSSGVFVESGDPITNYSDINTNGIILQAIAHKMDSLPQVPGQ